jgi:hypothetical protein
MNKVTNKRIEEMKKLMGIKENTHINDQIIKESVEISKVAPNGKHYAIVRENKKYFIKESNDGVKYDFIGGLGNKTKNQFDSFENATKRLNIIFDSLNEHYGIKENTNILTDDRLNEDKKYVLKKKKKKEEKLDFDFDTEFGFGDESGEEETTDTKDSFDFGDESGEEETTDTKDSFDFGDESGEETVELEKTDDETMDSDDESFDDESDDTDEEDPIKTIQRLTGKLGQKLRDTDDLSSETMKWVAKSVISALDVEDMSSGDKKDIIRSIKKKSVEGSDDDVDFMDDRTQRLSDLEISKLPYSEKLKYLGIDNFNEDNPNIGGDEEIEGELLFDEEEPMDDNRRISIPRSNFKNNTDYMDDLPFYDEDVLYPGMEEDWMSDEHTYGPGNTFDYDNKKVKNEVNIHNVVKRLKAGSDETEYIEKIVKYISNKLPGSEIMNNEIFGDDYNIIVKKNGIMVSKSDQMKKYFGFDEIGKLLYYIKENTNTDYMGDYLGSSPSPVKPKVRPETPTTKPGTDKPDPRKRPFTPPPFIRPGEEPAPKAKDRNDIDYMGYDNLGSKSQDRFEKIEESKRSYKKLRLKEDHLNKIMTSYDQEMAYEDVEEMARLNGFEIFYKTKDRSKDPEEGTIFLDIKKENKTVSTVRINSVGQIEMGKYENGKFKGEPIDSLSDFNEVLQEKGITMNNPKIAPSKPTTKPGTDKPDPRKRPFTPPPFIRPGEEPAPKAKDKRYE